MHAGMLSQLTNDKSTLVVLDLRNLTGASDLQISSIKTRLKSMATGKIDDKSNPIKKVLLQFTPETELNSSELLIALESEKKTGDLKIKVRTGYTKFFDNTFTKKFLNKNLKNILKHSRPLIKIELGELQTKQLKKVLSNSGENFYNIWLDLIEDNVQFSVKNSLKNIRGADKSKNKFSFVLKPAEIKILSNEINNRSVKLNQLPFRINNTKNINIEIYESSDGIIFSKAITIFKSHQLSFFNEINHLYSYYPDIDEL